MTIENIEEQERALDKIRLETTALMLQQTQRQLIEAEERIRELDGALVRLIRRFC